MSRVQLALNVNDLDEAITFYAKLFGVAPAKVKPGYANFAVTQPPLKLVLLENPGQGGTINHLGVEVNSSTAVHEEIARLTGEGLFTDEEIGTTCCFATQDKVWVTGPAGERWEVYTVLADSETFGPNPQHQQPVDQHNKVQVFEPALCCATGVCGEDVDEALVRFSADMDFVRSRGGDVSRYNLAGEALAFAEHQPVKEFLTAAGSEGLPLVLVDGVTVLTGRYPDRAQLAAWAGVEAPVAAGPAMRGSTGTTSSSGNGCCSSEDSDAAGCC
jgi:lactoylglutathione lyase